MSDLINREDAIKAVWECYKVVAERDIPQNKVDLAMVDTIQTTLFFIPSADRPQAWIPCSERLPSEQGQYLVTFPLCNGEPWVYILSFNKGKFYETDDEWGDVEYDDVTAWMPLPKPWKGADDEMR